MFNSFFQLFPPELSSLPRSDCSLIFSNILSDSPAVLANEYNTISTIIINAMLNAKHVGTRQSSRLLYRPCTKRCSHLQELLAVTCQLLKLCQSNAIKLCSFLIAYKFLCYFLCFLYIFTCLSHTRHLLFYMKKAANLFFID